MLTARIIYTGCAASALGYLIFSGAMRLQDFYIKYIIFDTQPRGILNGERPDLRTPEYLTRTTDPEFLQNTGGLF